MVNGHNATNMQKSTKSAQARGKKSTESIQMKHYILGTALSLLALNTPAFAEDDATATALGINTINAAQTLITSVEYMLDHSCQISLTESAEAVTALQNDVETFHSTLALLRTGGEAEGIAPVRSRRAQRALDTLESDVEAYLAFATFGTRGTMSAPYLDQLYLAHAPIPDASNEVVDVLNTTFMLQRIGMLESSTLGALTDITQRATTISANLCLIAVDQHSDAAITTLNGVLQEIEKNLDLLATGDAMQKILPPTPEMRAALDCVAADFTDVQSFVAPYLDGTTRPTVEQFAHASAMLGALEANAQTSVEVFEAGVIGTPTAIDGCTAPRNPAS